MILLYLSVIHPDPLGSRKLNDGDDGPEQQNRSHALDWGTNVNGRNGLSSGSLWIGSFGVPAYAIEAQLIQDGGATEHSL